MPDETRSFSGVAPDGGQTTPHYPTACDVTTAPTTPTSATAVGPGLLIADRYELGEELARGGMGVVYRAIEHRFGREVAVKFLLPKYAGQGPATRFFEEARITGRLQHPGIPPVFDVGAIVLSAAERPVPYLVMKLITGQTLAESIRNSEMNWVRPAPLLTGTGWRSRLVRIVRSFRRRVYRLLTRKLDTGPSRADLQAANPPELMRFIGLFEQICQTVAYAHDRQIIHRDLKPGNVMIGGFGEVQVMDWGLAKQLGQPEGERLSNDEDAEDRDRTQEGLALGTLAYMPPEQARGAIGQIDRRSDVFALGAILCHLLTGQSIYAGSTRDLRRQAETANHRAAFDRLDGSWLDPDLVALTKRCLAADPKDRLADAKEFADAIATCQNTLATRLEQAALVKARIEGEKRERSTALWKIGSVAGAILIIGFQVMRTIASKPELLAETTKPTLPAPSRVHPAEAMQSEVAKVGEAAARAIRSQLRKDGTDVGERLAALPDAVLIQFFEGKLKNEDLLFLLSLQNRTRAAAEVGPDGASTPRSR